MTGLESLPALVAYAYTHVGHNINYLRGDESQDLPTWFLVGGGVLAVGALGYLGYVAREFWKVTHVHVDLDTVTPPPASIESKNSTTQRTKITPPAGAAQLVVTRNPRPAPLLELDELKRIRDERARLGADAMRDIHQ